MLVLYVIAIGGATATAIRINEAWRRRPVKVTTIGPRDEGDVVLQAPALPAAVRRIRLVGWRTRPAPARWETLPNRPGGSGRVRPPQLPMDSARHGARHGRIERVLFQCDAGIGRAAHAVEGRIPVGCAGKRTLGALDPRDRPRRRAARRLQRHEDVRGRRVAGPEAAAQRHFLQAQSRARALTQVAASAYSWLLLLRRRHPKRVRRAHRAAPAGHARVAAPGDRCRIAAVSAPSPG